MPLLEKAAAKLDMNYDRLNYGGVEEGLRLLSGKPTKNFHHTAGKEHQYKPLIRRFAEMHYPMVAGCC